MKEEIKKMLKNLFESEILTGIDTSEDADEIFGFEHKDYPEMRALVRVYGTYYSGCLRNKKTQTLIQDTLEGWAIDITKRDNWIEEDVEKITHVGFLPRPVKGMREIGSTRSYRDIYAPLNSGA